MTPDDIITGEKIQELCDVYLGASSRDFAYNPRIAVQTHKHRPLDTLPDSYDNPPLVFCYTHCLESLVAHIHRFRNPFVLVTHNSDHGVAPEANLDAMVACPRLQKWYMQNLAWEHDKLVALPIGMANRQWPHGDVDFFRDFDPPTAADKTMHIYFNFNLQTHFQRRMECLQALQHKLPQSPTLDPGNYKRLLSQYRYCVCPEGNGYDTHRLWEALYLKVIPIVKRSPFITCLQRSMTLPMVVLERWEDLDPAALRYEEQWRDTDDIRFTVLRDRIHASVQELHEFV
jgi:hypothetical protein